MSDKPIVGPFTITHIIAVAGVVSTIAAALLSHSITAIVKKRKIKDLAAQLVEPYNFWLYVFDNPGRGTALEAIRADVVAQRKHIKEILRNLEQLERAIGCGDPELGLEARDITDEDMSKVRGLVIWLERQHHRHSYYYGRGPWGAYFKRARIPLSEQGEVPARIG